MDKLNQAINLACIAHEGQVDKGDEPYILHALRVMLRCETQDERIVAVLHDTIENTEHDKERITEVLTQLVWNFSNDVQVAVDAISRKKDENYKDYILRCADNTLARQVKIYDIEDNIDSRRVANISESLVDRYYKAMAYLYDRKREDEHKEEEEEDE